ncbi:MAG: hypothetical protein OHK0046_10590 [Anaerolineae bacterium]
MRRLIIWLILLFGVLSGGLTVAQSGVRAVVVNDFANIRIIPEIGAEVITTVSAGYVFDIVTGRNATGEWLRVDFNGEEGWVNVATLSVLEGDTSLLPVADPRSIPFGGFEAPRAGFTSATSAITGRLAESGIRLRAGPSTGYPVLANIPRYTVLPILGRTASSSWVQVNYEGILGWINNTLIQFNTTLDQVPIGGIVAESPPLSQPVLEDYIGTLRLLLARLDLAQPSLDTIRAYWTDAALTGRASCRPYPAQPSSFPIADDLLAVFYNQLNPIVDEFNDAMFNLRLAIQLFIDVCEQPGLQNPVGEATSIGALETIALTDRQFADLRRRINDLIPDDRDLGANECLFVFNNQADILPVIPLQTIIIDSFSPRRYASGYCIDLTQGQFLTVETYQRPNSNLVHLISISLLDNPTSFLAIGRGTAGTPLLTVGPVIIPQTGRYLIVVSNIGPADQPPFGEFALLAWQPTGVINSILRYDPATGEFFLGTTPAPGTTPTSVPPFGSTPPFNTSGTGQLSAVCPNTTYTCEQLNSCEQAYACLGAGNFNLDPDGDGVPCEVLRCPSTP